MTEENKKEIEDILAEPDKEDLDIEEAVLEPEEAEEEAPEIQPEEESAEEVAQEEVSEETASYEKTKDKKKTEKKEKAGREEKKEDKKDVLEKAIEAPSAEVAEKTAERPVKVKKRGWKIALLILLTILFTATAVLGGVYWWTNKNKAKTEETKTEVTVPEPESVDADNSIYVNSAEGLNLRKEPSLTGEILDIIPNGTKLTPLETNGDWIKVEYNGKIGWVNKEFTTTKNPLVYENTDYGFSVTFPASWANYKFIGKQIEGGTMTYYVALPTTDKNWSDPSGTSGYGSLFVISVYTKTEWQTVQAEELKPTKLGEKGNYVFAWSSGQAAPTDLADRFEEIKSIIDTFKVI